METSSIDKTKDLLHFGRGIEHLVNPALEVGQRSWELRERTGTSFPDTQTKRSELRDSALRLLTTAAMTQPLLMVVEGLPVTADQSLLFFGFLASVTDLRLLASSTSAAAQVPLQNVCRKEGDYWTIGTPKGAFRLKDAKGLHYIAHLLRHPGREFHVADLTGVGREPLELGALPAAAADTQAATASDLGDAGDVLDRRARCEYKRRLEELRSEIGEATEHADLERATRLREELDFITRELSAAYGVGGRSRKAADASDRIRKAVTARIRDSIAKISEYQPALGLHLSRSIATGSFCRYAPECPVEWNL